MWNSKDLALVTVLAALAFVTAASIGQMGYLITGIPGVNYIFIIFLAIQTGFGLLVYEGRRWRFFVQMTIFTLLIIPINLGAPSFDVLGKTHYIIAAFFTDILANSFYPFFKKHKRYNYWSILSGGLIYWTIQPLASMAINIEFYAPTAPQLISIMTLLAPVILVEAVAGSYLGYKIYRRINKESDVKNIAVEGEPLKPSNYQSE